MKQTAVVILNWNGRKLLEQFLPSLCMYTSPENADIIVADNGSTDDSISFLETNYPQIIIHALGKNYGFAEGYNKALENLNYQYVVLLNSDVEVSDHWLDTAIDYLEKHSEITAIQPKILSLNNKNFFEYAGACGGFLDKYGYPFCRGRILNTLEEDKGQYDEITPVFWISGACLIIRLEEYKNVGGLDANFFAHQEEIDLCWRLNARNKKLVCVPQSVVYHVGGATLDKTNSRKTYLNFRNNLLMIYKNMPESDYKTTMLIRFFLDYLSALHFVLKGQISNAIAVGKARMDFHRLKKQYKTIREENLKKSRINLPETIYSRSILREYYLTGKKKYSQLTEWKKQKNR